MADRRGIVEPSSARLLAEVLDQDIRRFRNQPSEGIGPVQVFRSSATALPWAAVQRQKEAAGACDERRPRARIVAMLRLFDFRTSAPISPSIIVQNGPATTA